MRACANACELMWILVTYERITYKAPECPILPKNAKCFVYIQFLGQIFKSEIRIILFVVILLISHCLITACVRFPVYFHCNAVRVSCICLDKDVFQKQEP